MNYSQDHYQKEWHYSSANQQDAESEHTMATHHMAMTSAGNTGQDITRRTLLGSIRGSTDNSGSNERQLSNMHSINSYSNSK